VAARDTVYVRARRVLVDSVAPRLVAWAPGGPRSGRGGRRSTTRRCWRVCTYARELPLFDEVLAREGGELRRAIARIIALARANAASPYDGLRAWVAQHRFRPFRSRCRATRPTGAAAGRRAAPSDRRAPRCRGDLTATSRLGRRSGRDSGSR
jgi:hypothetical protein